MADPDSAPSAPLPWPPSLAPGARYRPVPYASRLPLRDPAGIDLVVMHCTETPDLASAREFGERVLYPETGTGACGHYYIDRDGTVVLYVRPDRIAHHVRGFNARSVGIELVNTGRYPDWMDSRRQAMDEPYTREQVAALILLLARLRSELPGLRHIAGHEALDTAREPASDDPSVLVWRKRDPGPLFPWPEVLGASGLEVLDPEAMP